MARRNFTSTIDLSKASEAIRKGAARGLTLATEAILTEANKHVPHDEGTLERSGEASVDEGELKGAVSYDTPYAARQHEDMSLTHQGKGEPKWLETTLTESRDKVAATVQTAIKSELGT